MLLRAVRFTGAKALYIPYNSNRNPSSIAKVFFESEEDRDQAMNKSINYNNTTLLWKEYIMQYFREVEDNGEVGVWRQSISQSRRGSREISREEYSQLEEVRRNTYRIIRENNMSINKDRGKIGSEMEQTKTYEERRRTNKQQTPDTEESQKQLQNEDIFSLFQDLKKKIETLEKKGLRPPNRS